MDGLFSQLAMLGSSLVLIASFLLLWRRGIPAYVDAFTLQSLALGATSAVVGYFTGNRELYLVAGLLIGIKGVGIPLLLRRMARRLGSGREVPPYVNTATSLLVGGLLVLLAYIVMRPVVQLSELPTRAGMPLAMGVVFISLFVVISRRHALTQVIGFLMLENGIALLAVLGTYGIPLIVEIGVFLDVMMGFLVMQIFVYQIHETFQSLDVQQLNRLRR
jgi:hydrogenase-4 component E